MTMTVVQVNALIDLIGNTRQMPSVQSVYSQIVNGDLVCRIAVNWLQRRPGGMVKTSPTCIYQWDTETQNWRTV